MLGPLHLGEDTVIAGGIDVQVILRVGAHVSLDLQYLVLANLAVAIAMAVTVVRGVSRLWTDRWGGVLPLLRLTSAWSVSVGISGENTCLWKLGSNRHRRSVLSLGSFCGLFVGLGHQREGKSVQRLMQGTIVSVWMHPYTSNRTWLETGTFSGIGERKRCRFDAGIGIDSGIGWS